MKERILISDDDMAIRDGCAQTLKRQGYEILEASTGSEAMALLERFEFDLILLDIKMPDMSGTDILKTIRERDSDVPVIMITAYGTIQSAVETMRLGANDFLPKPFDPEELRLAVMRNLKAKKLAIENIYLKEELRRKEGIVDVIGKSRAMQMILERARKVAATDSTVLITGESGTGKGLLAKYIHQVSPRKEHPFVQVDCSTLVPSLFESELFGHVKGAFTGAAVNKIGKFELANEGTLFLDEIANIDLDLQAKLLKVVEEKEITKVGSNRLMKVDVRILAATNKDLRQLAREGRFREDLFFRLNVISLHMPPLRQRQEDISQLIQHFLRTFSQKHGKSGLFIKPDALEAILDYSWPGNVRELENTIERMVIFASDSPITIDDLELAGMSYNHNDSEFDRTVTTSVQASSASTHSDKKEADTSFAIPNDNASEQPANQIPNQIPNQIIETWDLMTLDEIEKQYVTRILEEKDGNRTETARILGIDRKTLRQKLKRWGLES